MAPGVAPVASYRGKIAVWPGDVLWNKIRIDFFGQPRFCERGGPAPWAEPTETGMGRATYLQMT